MHILDVVLNTTCNYNIREVLIYGKYRNHNKHNKYKQ